MILEVCDCFEHTLMEGIVVDEFVKWNRQSNVKLCDKRTGSPNYECVRKIILTEDQEALTKGCLCGAECNETEYKVSSNLNNHRHFALLDAGLYED